jgi:hypothetical protein
VVSIECSFLRIERLFIHRPAQRKNPAIVKADGEPQQERICNPREGGSIPDRRFSTGPFPVRYINIDADCKGDNFSIFPPPPTLITNSVTTRPITVGLSIFGSPENGVNFAIVSAGTLMSVAPLLIGFLLSSGSSYKVSCAPASSRGDGRGNDGYELHFRL